jgi:cation diffusion facilitator CzcD-associated flavoprotein CzcO
VAPAPVKASDGVDTEFCIIGAGWSGLMFAVGLLDEGYSLDSFRIVERGTDYGGAWQANQYPGCACDVQSYSYLPFLNRFPEYTPAKKYTTQPEIQAHAARIADRYCLAGVTSFGVTVDSTVWDEATKSWTVHSGSGDLAGKKGNGNGKGESSSITARFVVVCTGPLTEPVMPNVLGMNSFLGKSMHTSRWDHSVELSGKTVGIVGTGASAGQAITELCKDESISLKVFQR